jgi:hypothetical protein
MDSKISRSRNKKKLLIRPKARQKPKTGHYELAKLGPQRNGQWLNTTRKEKLVL